MSVAQQIKWSDYEGHLWYRGKRGAAYWNLCLECTRKCYPEVKRARNGSSAPPDVFFDVLCPHSRTKRKGPVLPKTMGDFYLTLPPPDRVTAAKAEKKGRRQVAKWQREAMTSVDDPFQNLFPEKKKTKGDKY